MDNDIDSTKCPFGTIALASSGDWEIGIIEANPDSGKQYLMELESNDLLICFKISNLKFPHLFQEFLSGKENAVIELELETMFGRPMRIVRCNETIGRFFICIGTDEGLVSVRIAILPEDSKSISNALIMLPTGERKIMAFGDK